MSEEIVIYGNSVGPALPKSDLRETDPKKGSYVYGQEYEKVTKVDIRHLIETGCYLLTSTGQPSNKTALLVDAGYAKIPVSQGERYRITTYIPNSSGIIFYGEDGGKVAVDEGGTAGGNVTVTDYEVTVPEGCAVMGVSTRKRTRNPIIVKKVEAKAMTPQIVGESLSQLEESCKETTENDDDRLYALENRLGFSFENLDKGKVIFMTDGTRPVLTDVYAIFEAHGMPLSVAPVYDNTVTYASPMNDNSTALEFLHRVEDDGGEIFAHSLNGNILTAETAEQMLRDSKEWLNGEGFNVHGWIAPQGVFCPEARRLYAKYYRYGYKASDRTGSPLNFERPYLSTLGLTGAKTAIDNCEADKSVIVLFHHWSDNEIEGFNLEDLEALLSYIESKDVDVTTYRDCFFNYGSFGNDEGNSSGGSEAWELIDNVTVTEPVNAIKLSGFAYKEITIDFSGALAAPKEGMTAPANSGAIVVVVNGISGAAALGGCWHVSVGSCGILVVKLVGANNRYTPLALLSNGNTSSNMTGSGVMGPSANFSSVQKTDEINSVELRMNSYALMNISGGTFRFYGR